MKAEYELDADLLVIELAPDPGGGYGELVPNGPIVQYDRDGRPLAIEVTSASKILEERLSIGAAHTRVDFAELVAIAHAAIANPDTLVELEIRRGGHLPA
jgi:hypothetical protein